MHTADLLNAGNISDAVPKGDAERQAVESLAGYVYQALAATLAWANIDENSRLYLEVAEDYATLAGKALTATQVKDTAGSGSVTLNSESIRKALIAFVDLVERNPHDHVYLHFLTTSPIGKERKIADRPGGIAGLQFWQQAATGADLSPLRNILQSERFPETVRDFCKARDNDETLRRELLQRISWDCESPDLSTLRQELEDRLVVLVRNRFSIPAQMVPQIANHLIYQVLKKTILANPQDRLLTLSELYRAIDGADRISLPQDTVDALLRQVSGMAWSHGGNSGTVVPISISAMGWLIDSADLPAPQGIIPRDAIQASVAGALEQVGVCVLVGGSGLGKTTISRAVAHARADNFLMVECRNTGADEIRYRLDLLLGVIKGLSSTALLLDDLSNLEDTQVVLSLARVIEVSRKHPCELLITCYLKPNSALLAQVGLDQNCIIECPYFSEEETRELVRKQGGEPGKWARFAHIVGADGHPQLTHAFVSGIATRGWPDEEIETVIYRGFSSEDIDAARDAARRHVASMLPKDARNLLYRLSLVTRRFRRSMALVIGEISPQVSQTGECLDRLIGPWIEAVDGDSFRVSPLASRFGGEMLSPARQKPIHQAIAAQIIREGPIDAGDVNPIVMHAIQGEAPQILATLAYSLNSLDAHALEVLVRYPLIFRFFRTDVPIYPQDIPTSWMLRFTQLRLAKAAGESSRFAEIAGALFEEIGGLPEGQIRTAMEATSLVTLLCTKGVANYLDNWLSLLLRLNVLVQTNDFLDEFVTVTEGSVDAPNANLLTVLFNVGIANLPSVERLEHIVNALDRIDPSVRASLLTPIYPESSDYYVFVNGAWVAQVDDGDFDAPDAARRYQRMARTTQSWGNRKLSLRCFIAQAIMLDEYQNSMEDALIALDEAVTVIGDDVLISRARAKVYRRQGDYEKALEVFRTIGGQAGLDDPIERAHALREAAICAAKCDQWSQSEEWFLAAQGAAQHALGDDMKSMAVGLGADSAVAALEAGSTARALERLEESLASVAAIDQDATLRGAYCHQSIRHTVSWMKSRLEKYKVNGQLTAMDPGTCSNPDPDPAIRENPVPHIDTAWYTLAQSETVAGLDLGITATLHDRLTLGPIPVMEASLRKLAIEADIEQLNADGFAAHFKAYVDSTSNLLKNPALHDPDTDPSNPKRGRIARLSMHPPFDPLAEEAAVHAILAYCICSALDSRIDSMSELERFMNSQFAGPFPGKAAFDCWNEKPASLAALAKTVLTTIKTLIENEYIAPFDFWVAGLCFLKWTNQSNFRNCLATRLATWQRTGWMRIAARERFRLSVPQHTAPSIENVLKIPTNDLTFVAKLLLAASQAVGIPLGSVYRNAIEAMANETESAPSSAPKPNLQG